MNAPAGSLACPSCGAPAAPDSLRCDHCATPLALVACPACFGRIFRGARFCSHCGAAAERAAGTELNRGGASEGDARLRASGDRGDLSEVLFTELCDAQHAPDPENAAQSGSRLRRRIAQASHRGAVDLQLKGDGRAVR